MKIAPPEPEGPAVLKQGRNRKFTLHYKGKTYGTLDTIDEAGQFVLDNFGPHVRRKMEVLQFETH